jgi:Ankyrin repeats (3 copies)
LLRRCALHLTKFDVEEQLFVNTETMSDITQFFEAVNAGDSERVRFFLEANPGLIAARDADGATALHHAAFNGQRSMVDLLCEAGAELNARDGVHGATPTGWAIHYLRERGGLLAVEIADVLYAIESRDVKWAQRLVARHPWIVDAKDTGGKPVAAYARECGDPAIAALFASASQDQQ